MKISKIILFDPVAHNRRVGIKTYTFQITKHISSLCQTEVFTSDVNLFNKLDCLIHPIKDWWLQGYLRRSFWEQLIFPKLLQNEKDNLLICPIPEIPILSTIPTIAIVHDLIPLKLRQYYSPQAKFYFWCTLQTLRKASFIITDSEFTRQQLMQFNIVPSNKIKTIYGGVERPQLNYQLDLISNKYGISKPFILYVGGFIKRKNVQRLLYAFAGLKNYQNYILILVGWGRPPAIAEIKKIINLLNLQENCKLLHNISDAELSCLYSNCEIFIFPSLYEGFGLPILEAMAHGAPVISSNFTSLPELGGDAVIYCNPLSIQDITNKMDLLLSDTKLRDIIKRKGLERVKLFNWQATVTQILEIINSL